MYSDSGDLLVVNRLNSYFNAGWWLAGLEQLVPFTTSTSAADTLRWVGGDGSARVFRETAATSCVFLHEAIDRPDSIVGTPSGGACTARERRTSHGLRVVFDTSGNHAQTINRIGEVTSFVYTAGMLDSVIAPATPAMNRAVKLTRVIGAVVGGAPQSRIIVFREPNRHRRAGMPATCRGE